MRTNILSSRVIKNGIAKYRAHPIYKCWAHMIDRCDNPNCIAYKWYGARGISVCEEWRDREVFAKWALENGWKEGLELDRIDVNGNYEPSNCRYVTHQQNMRNTRSNVVIDCNGKKVCITEAEQSLGFRKGVLRERWHLGKRGAELLAPVARKRIWKGLSEEQKETCKRNNISIKLLGNRIERGWDLERAINERNIKSEGIIYKGKRYSQSELCRKFGIPWTTFSHRIERGMSVEKAAETPRKIFHPLSKEEKEICRKNGISMGTYYARIEDGMSKEKAITMPIQNKPRITKEQLAIANSNGISRRLVICRLGRGWNLEEAITEKVNKKGKSK